MNVLSDDVFFCRKREIEIMGDNAQNTQHRKNLSLSSELQIKTKRESLFVLQDLSQLPSFFFVRALRLWCHFSILALSAHFFGMRNSNLGKLRLHSKGFPFYFPAVLSDRDRLSPVKLRIMLRESALVGRIRDSNPF